MVRVAAIGGAVTHDRGRDKWLVFAVVYDKSAPSPARDKP